MLSSASEFYIGEFRSDPTPVLQDVIKATLAKAKADFYVFLNAISSAEVLYYGASLWLAYSKLLVNTFGAKVSKVFAHSRASMHKFYPVKLDTLNQFGHSSMRA